MSNARDITLRQPIVVCPIDNQACKEEMDAIEQAAKDASRVNQKEPNVGPSRIIRAYDKDALRSMGWTMVAGQKKMVIE